MLKFYFTTVLIYAVILFAEFILAAMGDIGTAKETFEKESKIKIFNMMTLISLIPFLRLIVLLGFLVLIFQKAEQEDGGNGRSKS